MAERQPETCVVDVWGGPGSQEHVARFLRPIDEALNVAKTELLKGFLVNMRQEAAWGPEHEFDYRALS